MRPIIDLNDILLRPRRNFGNTYFINLSKLLATAQTVTAPCIFPKYSPLLLIRQNKYDPDCHFELTDEVCKRVRIPEWILPRHAVWEVLPNSIIAWKRLIIFDRKYSDNTMGMFCDYYKS